MTEKIEVNLTFQSFVEKNKSVVQLNQQKAETYQKLLTCKAVEEQTKDFGFSDNWKKELAEKINELKPSAEQELKDASENINKYLFNFVKAVFEFHRAVIELPNDEYLKGCAKTIRGLIAAGGGQLEAECIFNMVKVLYINTESHPSADKQ